MSHSPTMHTRTFMLRGILVFLSGVVVLSNALAQDQKATAKKPTRVVETICDYDSSEIASERGNFVCQYQCRDPDRSKIFQVYYSSSLKSCPSPLKAQIRQIIRDQKIPAGKSL